MYRRKRRILKSLVFGFAVAAIAAPAALAVPLEPGPEPVIVTAGPDDRDVYRGSSAQLDPQLVSSPDDRDVYRGSSAQLDPQLVGSPDDRKVFRGVETPETPVSVTVSSSSDDGFQWSDAGLGAASTLAIVLLMGAATLLIRHQRRRIAAF